MVLPTVAHLVNPYLFHTGSWIYTQIKSVDAYRPIVLTSKTINLDQFPVEPIYEFRAPFQGSGRIRPRLNILLERLIKNRERYFASAVRKENAMLLHAHFGPQGYTNLGVRGRSNIPLITTFYGYDVSRLPLSKPKWRDRYQRLFDLGDRFLAEGPHMGQCLADLGCSPEKIQIQHLGVDVGRIAFAERTLRDGQPIRILMAATFREKKGIPYAIEAFSQIAKQFPAAELRLLGGAHTQVEKELQEKCRQLAQKCGVASRVHFLGSTTYVDYLNEVAGAHLFLAPSVHASDGDTEGGAPVSLIEAAAAGIPAVATYHCDIPEVVLNGITGLLVKERDVAELASALVAMLAAPQKWPEYGRAARAHAEKEFDMQTQARKLEGIYANTIKRSS